MRPDEDPNGRRAAQFTPRGLLAGTLFPVPHWGMYSPPVHARGCRLPPPWRLGRWRTRRVPPTHAFGEMRTPLTRLIWSEASRGMARPAAIPGMNLTVEPAAATIASVSVETARPAVLTGRLAATPLYKSA